MQDEFPWVPQVDEILRNLRNSLRRVPEIKSALENSGKPLLESFAKRIDICDEARTILETAIAEHPPITVKEGGVIKDGFNEKLDQYRDASKNGKVWLANWNKKNVYKQVLKH